MLVVYVCPVCAFETEPMEPPPPSPCPNCHQDGQPLTPKEDSAASDAQASVETHADQ